MGATALLIAALKAPQQFSALILYEPIVKPPALALPYSVDMKDSPLAVLARKRRNTFFSLSSARDNFLSKMPFSSFDPDVVQDYVNHGFVSCRDTATDALAESGGNRQCEGAEEKVCLRCTPEFEAFVYNTASSYDIHDRLGELPDIPITVMSGILLDI